MSENPFDACWNRLDRVSSHRIAVAGIWNRYIADHPYDFSVTHAGDGVHLLEVRQTQPMPAEFVLEFGEWLYNARTCLDYIVWATATYVTGQLPPPDEGTLQYPVYESLRAWKNNERRLKHLAPHHREVLLHMQSFNGDADANYLRVVNDLARIDRHRRLTVSTAYLAELEPLIEVPHGSKATLEWGERVLRLEPEHPLALLLAMVATVGGPGAGSANQSPDCILAVCRGSGRAGCPGDWRTGSRRMGGPR